MASIERNAQSQARVVEDLIELSRVVTGKLQLRTQTDGPARRGRGGARCRPHGGSGERCDARIEAAAVAGHRLWRPRSLQQVIWNLLSNAVKFTESGGTVTRRTDGRRAQLLDRRRRHRHRDFAGISALHLRALPPGRSVDDAGAWRPRPGTRDRKGDQPNYMAAC